MQHVTDTVTSLWTYLYDRPWMVAAAATVVLIGTAAAVFQHRKTQ